MSLPEEMGHALGVEAGYVSRMARTASHLYRVYQVRKRSGGSRTIHHPSRELKALQRWLVSRVFRHLPVHEASTAYEVGSSIRKNATLHAGSRYLLRLDLAEFFPSITQDDVVRFLVGSRDKLPEWWQEEDSSIAARLVCRRGALTIGAASSPCLANRMCLELDKAVSGACERSDVSYSRYADDLFFSTNHEGVLREVEELVSETIASLDCPASLSVNPEKTAHLSKKNRRVVTGLVLTSDGRVSLGRALKRRVRGAVFRFERLDSEEQQWLRGMIAFARAADPDFVSGLFIKYGSARLGHVVSPFREEAEEE